MAGYSSRQSKFTTGDTILAAHSNDEFNQMLAAFNATVAAGAPNYNMLKRVIDPQSQLAAATAAFTLQQHKRDARLEKLRAEQTVRNHVYKAETFLRDLNAAQSKISPFTTGGAGKLASFVAGTPAYALKQDIITLSSKIALDAMAKLKELSATGSTGFGALSAPELELLQKSIASLEQAQDPKTLLANFQRVREHYTNMANDYRRWGTRMHGLEWASPAGPPPAPQAMPPIPDNSQAVPPTPGAPPTRENTEHWSKHPDVDMRVWDFTQ